ncbi:alpha/beta hydrolase [Actinoplanes sp. NPDC051859]|uniref:alpha/beta hydrolase n=1 Tax=Actinoplanes sp. NPDC051859 TaxID=3363909 RepID=UPI00379DCC53
MSVLQATDPRHWSVIASAWRILASTAGIWSAELRQLSAALRTIWQGRAALAAGDQLLRILRRLDLFRLDCWAADQALSEFAAALDRARRSNDLGIATAADIRASKTLREVFRIPAQPPGTDPPACTATPAEVNRWWNGLDPAHRGWLLVTGPGWIGSLDGIPAAARDRANRLLLNELRGSGALAHQLAEGDGLRAYLLQIDPTGDGRAVLALGDPDSAANVVTHVPGMTADLASVGGELARVARLSAQAGELSPGVATSAILWLGYDAPDHLGEAVSRAQADRGATALRYFQEGLRATHEGLTARQTVLGHSYGSLVVGTAAAEPAFDADSVVFVGSPGVGVDAAAHLHVPSTEVWATTSLTDPIQWAAVSPRSLAEDALLAPAGPAGALLAFGRPERDLFFGRNPADPAFGGRTFAAQASAGHLGYWAEGGPALDALAHIVVGSTDVIPR